ncbi:MAG: fibronectin type III domain-containing protein [Anaeromyxobacteraceae bacterium]
MLAAACADRPKPARQVVEPLPPSRPQRIATFEAVIEPPTPGPGGSRGSALWTVIPEGTDQNAGTNPPRTVEIASVTPFIDVGPVAPGCDENAIQTPVRITNYLPERLAGLFVTITSLTSSTYAVCDPGVLPVGGNKAYEDPDFPGTVTFVPPGNDAISPYGSYIDYTDVLTYPYESLAGSAVADGSAPGALPIVKDWNLNYPPVGSGPFVIKGAIWADPFPNAPRVAGDTLGDRVEGNETLHWFLYDNKDDFHQPRVTQMRATICSAPFVNGSCSGIPFVLDDFNVPSNGFVDRAAPGAGWGSYDSYLGDFIFTVGQRYYLEARTHWNPGGGVIDGTFAQQESFIVTGPPVLKTPADNATDVLRGVTAFTWTVDYPYETVPSSDRVFILCKAPDCSALGDPIFDAVTTTSAAEGPANTWTYTFTADLTGLTAGTDYFWSARNHFAGRNGEYVAPFKFTTAP